jgi:hypothetical protein
MNLGGPTSFPFPHLHPAQIDPYGISLGSLADLGSSTELPPGLGPLSAELADWRAYRRRRARRFSCRLGLERSVSDSDALCANS